MIELSTHKLRLHTLCNKHKLTVNAITANTPAVKARRETKTIAPINERRETPLYVPVRKSGSTT